MKAFAVLAFANAAFAICPGYNYGVGNVISLGSGVSRCKHFASIYAFLNYEFWTLSLPLGGFVYDANCNHVDSLTTTLNPCNSGTFTCTPPPITFNSYTNIFNGLKYVKSIFAVRGCCSPVFSVLADTHAAPTSTLVLAEVTKSPSVYVISSVVPESRALIPCFQCRNDGNWCEQCHCPVMIPEESSLRVTGEALTVIDESR